MELVQIQNRKLDSILLVVALAAGSWLHDHHHDFASAMVAVIALAEIGMLGSMARDVAALGRRLYAMLTRRQRRVRTKYKVGGQLFYAVPITRAVQEQLMALVPDTSLEASQLPSGILAVLGGQQPGEPQTASEVRRQWALTIGSIYEQLAVLLVYAQGAADHHPDAEWLGDVVPVARAQHLLQEIQERAVVEDNLPA